ncbi:MULTISPECIES: DsbA family protein [Halomonadaceae]|jgi:protein-disulfide isomerase|uniref:Thiol:disulfide interchange protein DsbL n=2 Tax=Halomonadaceae TaxID=28256 RepID=A0AAP9NPV7_9GAMM|nr:MULTISPECIES: thioredoxin domain-containing protein [Halomonas]NAO94843.1 thioredoxin domain-containing protein [Halomonas sp. MG34]QGQ71829.1 disulfide bond formation protein DsbA [Halomonas sp. PA16-9]PKH60410.1 disulfide bond formation protein DsbA [Halomonas sp. Choline-3u-9]QKS25840.1 Thiol:disulfide interchange protein DsbL [Halomonas titanicae]CDG52962.1 DSBA oxidoreductase [Halomonas sp. A3H3]
MFKKATFMLAGTLMLTAAIVVVLKPALLDMQAEAASEDAGQAESSLVRSHSPILGPQEAPITIVEFFDPACEACRAFYPLTKSILETYPEQVQLIVRYTPFHGEVSDTAIRVLEVARHQDVFEPVLEALLSRQDQWASHGRFDESAILEIASQAGLDRAAAEEQLNSAEVQAVIDQDMADVKTNQIRQTPTFFVNGELLEPFGMQELIDVVKSEIEEISEEAKAQ